MRKRTWILQQVERCRAPLFLWENDNLVIHYWISLQSRLALLSYKWISITSNPNSWNYDLRYLSMGSNPFQSCNHQYVLGIADSRPFVWATLTQFCGNTRLREFRLLLGINVGTLCPATCVLQLKQFLIDRQDTCTVALVMCSTQETMDEFVYNIGRCDTIWQLDTYLLVSTKQISRDHR